MSESIKKTVSMAYIASVVSRGFELTFFYLLFKYFAVDVVGTYSWLVAISSFVALLLDMGISQSLIRSFSNKTISLDQAIRNSLFLRMPAVVVLIVIMTIWYKLYHPEYELLMACFLVGIIQVVFAGEILLLSWLKSNEQQVAANIIAALEPIGRTVILAILIQYGTDKLHLTALFFLILCVHLAILSILIAFVNKKYNVAIVKTKDVRWLPERQLISSSLIFGLIGICTVSQNRLDWLLVSSFISKAELATYSLANKIYEMYLTLFSIAITTVYPWLCKTDVSLERKLKIDLVIILINCAGITLTTILSLYLPDLLFSIWGTKYASSNDMIRLLMIGAAFSVLISTVYYMLISSHREMAIIHVMVIATVAQLLTNLASIPRFGAYGAVVGMLVLIAVTALGFAYIVYRHKLEYADVVRRLGLFLLFLVVIVAFLWIFRVGMVIGSLIITAIAASTTYSIVMNPDEQLMFKKSMLYRIAGRA